MGDLVSVIIPTFNRAARLPVAVRSVLAQTWRPLEIVVVDDGSPDDTPQVLRGLEPEVAAGGAIARFISQQNGGAASARNAGMKAATGQWIAFLDDDDRWYPHKLAAQMARLAESGAEACSAVALLVEPGGFDLVPEKGVRLIDGFHPAEYLRTERHAHINSVLVKREAAERAGEFDTSLRATEDLEWLARLVHEAEFCAVPEVLLSYDRSAPEGALTHHAGREDVFRDHANREAMLLKIRERCGTRRGWDESAWRFRAGLEFRSFVRHRLRARQWRKAIELFEKGMELSHGAEPLARLRGKVRKARFKALFGG